MLDPRPHVFWLLLILLIVFVASPVMPAHAVPITIDGLGRSVSAEGLGTDSAVTSALGLFSGTAAVSGLTVLGEMSASAFQISDISLLGNVLTVSNAGSTMFSTALPSSNEAMGVGWPNVTAGSFLSLAFTIDNWASYDTHSLLNGGGLFWTFVGIENANTFQTIFATDAFFGSPINDTHRGILSPGTYAYRSFT
jgi:hypothetical protein